MEIGPDIAPADDPLAILIRQVKKLDQRYSLKGDAYYGWWTGAIGAGVDAFIALTGSHVYEPRWHEINNPELNSTRTPSLALYVALFHSDGTLASVEQSELESNSRILNRGSSGPTFHVEYLEAFLTEKYKRFESRKITIRPFRIPEIGVVFHPLLWSHENYLAEPEDYADDEKQDIESWIMERNCELLFGNDYYLDGDGVCFAS